MMHLQSAHNLIRGILQYTSDLYSLNWTKEFIKRVNLIKIQLKFLLNIRFILANAVLHFQRSLLNGMPSLARSH